jgi:hypothetical protein
MKAASMYEGRVRVALRLRPLLDDEKESDVVVTADQLNSSVVLNTPEHGRKDYTYDVVFGPTSEQSEVFDELGRHVADDFMNGFNGTVFAYGQTGTGKTFTMSNACDERPGLIPTTIRYIIGQAEEDRDNEYQFRVAYVQACSTSIADAIVDSRARIRACTCFTLQIYMEMIQDLLKVENCNLQIREDADEGVFLQQVRRNNKQHPHTHHTT